MGFDPRGVWDLIPGGSGRPLIVIPNLRGVWGPVRSLGGLGWVVWDPIPGFSLGCDPLVFSGTRSPGGLGSDPRGF